MAQDPNTISSFFEKELEKSKSPHILTQQEAEGIHEKAHLNQEAGREQKDGWERLSEILHKSEDVEAKWEAQKKAAKAVEGAMRFNSGKLKWSLVDFNALIPMVQVLMYGAKKYTPNNWKKGLSKNEILESMLRHAFELLEGNLIDEESKEEHIGHIMCNALFYSYFTQNPEKARE